LNSIDFAHLKAKRQMTSLKNSKQTCTKHKNNDRGLFEELGLSSQQFKILFHDLPFGLALYKIVYDKEGTPVDFIPLEVNRGYERILGLKREQIVRKQVAKLYPKIKSELVDWTGIYGKVATTGSPELFEAHCPPKDNYFQVYVYSPKKGYCISAFMDITEQKNKATQELAERKKAELELKESAEKYQYLVKHAPTGIYEIDLNGPKFKSANEAMCKILGYSEQELFSMNPFDLLYAKSKKRLQQRIERGLKGQRTDDSVEYHAKTKDGRGIWCILNLKLTFKDGRLDGALLVAQDITERKKAEEELVFAEKRYRRLYETTQDGIMARDLRGRMIDCNKAYAKMLGYTGRELKRLTVQQLLPEKWHEQREKVVNKVLDSGRSIIFEREYKRKDGSIFPASVRTWRLTDDKGRVTGIWSIVRDITPQKDFQKNLEAHAEILEKIVDERTKQLKDSERLAAIGQTAGMVGHDLRNPLQTITGELYLAKSEVESLVEGEAKNNLQESIQVIEEQAVYMDKIVSDLQAFVRPVKVDKKPINLKELVNAVSATVSIPNNVKVEILINDNHPEIKADPQLLKRVLINLVTNAVQAMPIGGKLTISSKVNLERETWVTVKDTGVGIPDHIKQQIFTPLFTTKPRGQGFGLAVCKRVIEAHGGTITFESTAGKGTEFTIQLPAN
jgi:PAS domain S-box-containing protein